MGRASNRQTLKQRNKFLENYLVYLNDMVKTIVNALDQLKLTPYQQGKFQRLMEDAIQATPAPPESSSDQKNYTPLESPESPLHSEDTHSQEHKVPDPDSTP